MKKEDFFRTCFAVVSSKCWETYAKAIRTETTTVLTLLVVAIFVGCLWDCCSDFYCCCCYCCDGGGSGDSGGSSSSGGRGGNGGRSGGRIGKLTLILSCHT